jgi:hypothetical protein
MRKIGFTEKIRRLRCDYWGIRLFVPGFILFCIAQSTPFLTMFQGVGTVLVLGGATVFRHSIEDERPLGIGRVFLEILLSTIGTSLGVWLIYRLAQ